MILQVSIGDVEVCYDDGNDDTPTPATLDAALTVVRQNALLAWMAMPTILDTDHELNQVAAEPVTEGDA